MGPMTMLMTGPMTGPMTGSNGLLSVPTEHLPGLVALVVLTPALWVGLWALRALAERGVGWASSALGRVDDLSFTAKAAMVGVLVGAVVHGAIVPTHWGDERTTAVLFIVDTVGFALAFGWTFA